MILETEETTKTESPAKQKVKGAQLSFWETGAPGAPAPRRLSKAALGKLVLNLNPELSATVGNEIIEGKLQPATWALALAYSNGSRDQAMTHYARLRLESLADQSTETKLKEQALEARRKAGFRKMTVPLPRLYLGNLTPAGMRNRRRISLSPVWLAGLWLSGTAACAAISRFYSESFYDPSSRISVSGSIGIIALLLMAIIMLHLLIPKTRLLIRYAIPMGAWTAACTSCYFGLMILKSNNSGNLTDRGSYEKTILPEETSQNGPARKHDATKSVAQTR